jgi:hypothetical protein
MAEQAHIEQQIREVLAAETHAIALSNKLFSPTGLFAQLGATEEARRRLVKTPLFKEAQKLFLDLQYKEAAEFARALRHTASPLPEGNYFFKLEGTESP